MGASALASGVATDSTMSWLAAVAPTPVDTTPEPATTDNEFLPAERNLSECISAVPKPGCGSKQRGGWRQALVFAVVVAGLLAIGVRVGIAVRRRDRELAGE